MNFTYGFPIGFRGGVHVFFEQPGEIVRIVITEQGRNLFYPGIFGVQQLTGFLHFQVYEIFDRRHTGGEPEELGKMRDRIFVQIGEILNPDRFVQIIFHIVDGLPYDRFFRRGRILILLL